MTQIDLYHLVQMADLLDVSIDWLLGREGTPEIRRFTFLGRNDFTDQSDEQ